MLKQILQKMGLVTKGKVIEKNDSKIKTEVHQVKGVTVNTLTDSEIDFILTKLRSANYTGAEFEKFSNVWMKLVKYKVK